MIRFNSTGQRTQYRLELYKHGGEDMYKKIAEWSLKGSSPHERLSRSNKTENRNEILNRGIFPDVVKVVVVKEEPFVIEKEGRIGNDRFEGFTIDLLKLLQEKLKFHYLVYVSPLNQYGANRNGGHWDGMVGEIISKNATLAMGAISITSQREAVIDFSLGVISTGVNILVSKPDEQYTIFQFLKPFSLELWMAILGSSVVVCIMYFLLDYTRPQRKFTLKETLWFSIGTLLKRGTDFSPGPVSQRVISVGFGFFVLITVATYTANMAAFLTTTNLGKTVKSFESLAETENMACGTVNNSATMNFLKMGTKPVFRRLWEKIVETNGLVLDSQQGRDMVAQGSYAFIFDYLINTYSEGVHCETLSVSSPILIQEHGIGMIAGAPFKTSINIELLKLKKSGKIQELKKKWWDDKKQCETDQENTAKKQVQFGLKHTAGVFIMGVFGTACGVAFFLFKKFYLIAKPIEDREKEILSRESPATISRCSKSSEPTPV